jgi:hypothetical protein
VFRVRRAARLVGPLAALALLTSCVAIPGMGPGPGPEPEPTPEREFAARELNAALLTADEYGAAWTPLPDAQGGGSGPLNNDQSQYDPCTWSTGWLPDNTSFGTQSWRAYGSTDGSSYVMDWILAAAPGVDLTETLDDFEAGIAACGGVGGNAEATLTLTTGPGPDFGDASFTYDVVFTYPDGSNAQGEVHTVVCGPLWVHLSYSGWEPFVERDRLLPLLLERAAALGGCEP